MLACCMAISLGAAPAGARPAGGPLARQAGSRTVVLTISAMIDGRSTLTISGKTAVWTHYQEAAPGLHEGANAPTIVGGSSWLPKWPRPGENRNCGCSSSVFRGVNPPLPATGAILFTPVSCRESCTATTGAGTAVINFDDVAIGSDAQYTVTLTYQAPSNKVTLSGIVRSQECATDATGATINPCKLQLVPVAGRAVEVTGAGGTATAVTGMDGTYSVMVKKGRHTLRVSGSPATVVPESRTVHATADIGSLDFLVPARPYALKMIGLARRPIVGPLPSPISPNKIAVGDTVTFALYGWDPRGGPVAMMWGSKRLGGLRPDPAGTAVGEFKIDDFQKRGTLSKPELCSGTLTATQGTHRRALDFNSVIRGVMVLNERTKSSLKAGELFCLGEKEILPQDFEAAGGAIVFTEPNEDVPLEPADLAPDHGLNLNVRDDLTHVNVDLGISNGSRLCLRLGTNRWVVISAPHPGEIATIDHAAPCLPGPTPPPDPLIAKHNPDNEGYRVEVITTGTTSMDVVDTQYLVYPQSTLFTKHFKCEYSRLYGEASMSFPAGMTGHRCVLFAQGSVEIAGPILRETVQILAGGDIVLSGSGG